MINVSEKLYKVVEAVDLFDDGNSIPERYLVFMDSNGHYTKAFFPSDRITLFFNEKLYDWYGREVELDPEIAKIISSHGCCSSCYGAGELFRETFEVQRPDGTLAIATLLYKDINGAIQDLVKSDAIEMAYQRPVLSICAKWSFRHSYDSNESFRNYLSEITKNLEVPIKVFAGVSNQDWGNASDYVAFAPTRISGSNYCWVMHLIAKDRDDILKSNVFDFYKKAVKSYHVCGGLSLSSDGKKVTSNSPMPDQNGNTRISADLETINHTKRLYAISWYCDPEP